MYDDDGDDDVDRSTLTRPDIAAVVMFTDFACPNLAALLTNIDSPILEDATRDVMENFDNNDAAMFENELSVTVLPRNHTTGTPLIVGSSLDGRSTNTVSKKAKKGNNIAGDQEMADDDTLE